MRQGWITFYFRKIGSYRPAEMAQGSDTQNSKISHLDHPLAHLYSDT